jgi:hypothetical protein
MKKTLIALFCAGTLALSGCSTVNKVAASISAAGSSPTTVTTLEVLGASVDASMKVAAGLYHNGQITAAQWNTIANLHDNEFLPAYNAAVAAVQYDTNQPAAPNLLQLAGQIATAVQQMTNPTPS